MGISYHLQGVYMSPVATPTTPPLQLITIDRRVEDHHSSCKIPAPGTQAPTKRHTYRMMALAAVHAYIVFHLISWHVFGIVLCGMTVMMDVPSLAKGPSYAA